MKKRFDYAVVFLSFLREHPGEFIDVKTIAKNFRLPPAYLEKVAQEFKRAGWLESRKGAGGGYRLTKDSRTVSIKSLINFYEPMYLFCPVLRQSVDKVKK